jgi:hypothetical protein
MVLLEYSTSANNFAVIIKYHGLTWSDGSLGGVEVHRDMVFFLENYLGGDARGRIPDLDMKLTGFGDRLAGNIVNVIG